MHMMLQHARLFLANRSVTIETLLRLSPQIAFVDSWAMARSTFCVQDWDLTALMSGPRKSLTATEFNNLTSLARHPSSGKTVAKYPLSIMRFPMYLDFFGESNSGQEFPLGFAIIPSTLLSVLDFWAGPCFSCFRRHVAQLSSPSSPSRQARPNQNAASAGAQL